MTQNLPSGLPTIAEPVPQATAEVVAMPAAVQPEPATDLAPAEPVAAIAPRRDPREVYQEGQAFLLGLGVEKNEGLAIARFLDAADLGHADAAFKAGLMYFAGVGITRNEPQARELARRALELGLDAPPAVQYCRDLQAGSLGTVNATRLLAEGEQAVLQTLEQAAKRRRILWIGAAAVGMLVLACAAALLFHLKRGEALELPPATAAAVVPAAEVEQAGKDAAVAISRLRAAAAAVAAQAGAAGGSRSNDF